MPSAYRSPYPPDICDKEGTEGLIQRIKGYWKARGFDVQVVAQEQTFNKSMRSCYYVIRSDLRNALPRQENRV